MLKRIKVTLANGEEGEIACLANGATAIRYRQVFHEDLLIGIGDLLKAIGTDNLKTLMKESIDDKDSEEVTPERMNALVAILGSGKLGMVSELAYVMAKQAAAAENAIVDFANRMTVEDYIKWTEQYDSMTFLTGAVEFINLYISNKAGTSTPKKEDAQLSAR